MDSSKAVSGSGSQSHMKCPNCGAPFRFKPGLMLEPGNYTFCLKCFRIFRFRPGGEFDSVADEAAPGRILEDKNAAMRGKTGRR